MCSSQTECHSSVTPLGPRSQMSSFNKRCAGVHTEHKRWECLIFPAEDAVRKNIVFSNLIRLSHIRANGYMFFAVHVHHQHDGVAALP